MLVIEPRVPVFELRELRGWGGIAPSSASVQRIRDADELRAALMRERLDGRGVIARGAGRAYGDAAQNGGGDVLDMTGLTHIRAIDAVARTVTVEAGVTLGRLLATLAGCGLTLPVVPGTRFVTVGGAIRVRHPWQEPRSARELRPPDREPHAVHAGWRARRAHSRA